MSQHTEYPLAPFEVTLKIIFVNDPDELYDDHHIDFDIIDTVSRSFRQKLISEGGDEYWAITCVFNPDGGMTVGQIAKEAYWATEILFKHLGEEEDCHNTKYAMIAWIADKIDSAWMQYELNLSN